jgi:nitrite reductase/ring-hydroxylating ferredoxin subunit
MHVTIRRYSGSPELADALVARQSEVRDLITGIDGFQAYYFVRGGDGEAASISVFDDATGGEVRALADRCAHRGGVLHEGELVDGCVECPLHGSRFRLDDGSVERGPSAYPQPAYEVRVQDGRIAVRAG